MTQTSTSAGTANATGFGAAEIAYLLTNSAGAVKAKNIEVMQIRPEVLTEQISALGASSLLARGELTADGDRVELAGAARLLNHTLARAERWTEIALVNDTGVEAALYIQSRELSIFLQPAALSTWFMVVKVPEASDASMLKQIIDTYVSAHPEAAVYFGSQTLGTDKAHFFVRASDGGTWDVAHVESPGEQDRVDGLGTDDLLAQLAELAELPQAARP